MSEMSEQYEEYVRVEHGDVLEYPVYLYHIVTRGHKIESYDLVTPVPPPVCGKYQYAARRLPAYSDGVWWQQWEIRDRRLTNEEAAARVREETIAAITQLEAKQPRAVREMLLGIEGAKERLQALDDEIAALRAQLNG